MRCGRCLFRPGLFVQRRNQRLPLLRRQLQKRLLVFRPAAVFDVSHRGEEEFPLFARVTIGHIDCHECANGSVLRTRGGCARDDRFSHLVEKPDFLRAEHVDVAGRLGGVFRRSDHVSADQRKTGGNGYQFQQFTSVHHRLPFLRSETANSAARAVSAM